MKTSNGGKKQTRKGKKGISERSQEHSDQVNKATDKIKHKREVGKTREMKGRRGNKEFNNLTMRAQ